ncbi:hypothetical protein LTR95_001366 [Oleoguttula sp. CCFEE 5521]
MSASASQTYSSTSSRSVSTSSLFTPTKSPTSLSSTSTATSIPTVSSTSSTTVSGLSSSSMSSTTGGPSTSSSVSAVSSSTVSESISTSAASTTSQTTSSTSNSLAAPTASQPPICPAGNGTAYTDLNGRAYRIWCDVDSQPGSYRGTAEASFQACINACDADTRCGAVGFNPDPAGDGGCYFKTGSATLQTSIGQELAIYIPVQSGPAPVSNDLCPSRNETSFTDRNGFVYMLYCGYDSSPGAFNSSVAADFRSCIAMCDEQTSQPCRAVTFTGTDETGGACYFKIAPDSIAGSSGVQLAVWQGLAVIRLPALEYLHANLLYLAINKRFDFQLLVERVHFPVIVKHDTFYQYDNEQHLHNAFAVYSIDLGLIRISGHFISDHFNIDKFIFDHCIFSHFVFGHYMVIYFIFGRYIFNHFLFGPYVSDHFVFDHFIFGHFVSDHFVFDHFVAHISGQLNIFPVFEHFDKHNHFIYRAVVLLKLFDVLVLVFDIDRVADSHMHCP